MIAVIGDVHGCINTLRALVSKVRKSFPRISVYQVGDLVDRGLFSAETVSYILDEGIQFCKGNHDFMFLEAMRNKNDKVMRTWFANGGSTTVDSYSENNDCLVPHLDAIVEAPLFFDLDDCFISHAGLARHLNSVYLKDGMLDHEGIVRYNTENVYAEDSILWNRSPLMDIGKLQIVGHTRQQNINFVAAYRALYIDTSVYSPKKLSAVVIDEGEVIEQFSVGTSLDDLPDSIFAGYL